MKPNFLHILCLLAAAASFHACQSEEAPQDRKSVPSETQVQVPQAVPDDFINFVNNFPAAPSKDLFNKERIEAFWQQMPINEVSTKLCERFIYGKPIFVASVKDYKASSNEFFYYVGKLRPSPAYYSLIVVTSIGKDNSAYLLNYSSDGKYISGIRLHVNSMQNWSGKYELQPDGQGLLVSIWRDDESRDPMDFQVDAQGKIVETTK